MKSPNYKLIARWTGEALVVFFSILLGFWVENYRQESQDKEEYLKLLTAFRNGVYGELANFVQTENVYPAKIKLYNGIDSLLKIKSKSANVEALNILVNDLRNSYEADLGNSQSITNSLSKFSFELLDDSIEFVTSGYDSQKESLLSVKLDFNNSSREFLSFLRDRVDFNDVDSNKLGESDLFKIRNYISHETTLLIRIVAWRGGTAKLFVAIVKNIDKVLTKHGKDISKFERNYLKSVE